MDRDDKYALLGALVNTLIGTSKGDRAFKLQMMKAFDMMPVPESVNQSTEIANLMADFTAHAIGCEALYHIQDHSGKDCVADMIKIRVSAMYEAILMTIEDGCTECNMDNPLKGTSVNEQLVKDILAEGSDA